MNGQSALNAYAQTNAHASVFDASPHKLISLLFEGANTRLAATKSAMANNDIARRGELISKAIEIISTLQANLDMEKGGDVSKSLEALYDYMIRQLLEANRSNSPEKIDEVVSLLSEVKSGWDAIAPEAAG